jgi:radical SAM superfamily enzyme YgiQ (UPF0313 family)
VPARSDILLVSLYESGHAPLGIAAPAAFLEQAGFAPSCLDLAVETLDDDALARIAGARVVAASIPMHTALRLALRFLPQARAAAPDARIVCHGLYATLHAAALRRAGAQDILGAEVELELVELVKAVAAGGEPAAGAGRLRRLPYLAPSRAGLPAMDRYAKLIARGGRERRLAGSVEATRGCKHMCRHCPIPAVYGGRFFAIPVEVVIADAAAQIAAGARHITFTDADFLNGPRHAVAVAEALHASFPGVTWDATIKVEHLLRHRDVLGRFAALGCVFVVSAFESMSDRVLAILDKGHAVRDAREALAIARAAGISLRPTFVPFTPWTTLDDLADLCAFIDDDALWDEVDPVQLSLRLLVPPGSLLLQHELARRAFGPLDEDAGTHVWTHADPRMDRLQLEVAAIVERAAADGEAPAETFRRIRALVDAAAGRPPAPGIERPTHAEAPPRLSEPWFC